MPPLVHYIPQHSGKPVGEQSLPLPDWADAGVLSSYEPHTRRHPRYLRRARAWELAQAVLARLLPRPKEN